MGGVQHGGRGHSLGIKKRKRRLYGWYTKVALKHEIMEMSVSDRKGNIVIIGAGYGGLTATLRLSRLLLKHPEYRVHLIDKHPYHTLKTQLHEAAVRKTEVAIPIDRIINKLILPFTRKR